MPSFHHIRRASIGHGIRRSALYSVLLAVVLLLVACDGQPAKPADTHASTATESVAETVAETVTETVAETAPTAESATTPETPPESETALEAETEGPLLYYVCNVTEDPVGTAFRAPYETLDAAISLCDRLAAQGYRVVSSRGELVYAPYTELQCDILRECKWVTDYVRENGFVYGDAAINPAISHRDKKVSCDRLVCWVMYRVGFTEQPRTQGVVVSAMASWCERNDFHRVTRVEDLQPGDIVLVNWNGSYPAHTFIYAGESGTAGQYYRYDCGSNTRIQSVQPSCEPLTGFWRAYRAPEMQANESP